MGSDRDSRISDLVKNPDGTDIISCGEFRWNPEGLVNQIRSLHLHAGAPGIFSDLLRSVQMPKREWGAEINGKLPLLFIPSKTAALVPEFAMEDLSLSRTGALVPEFVVKACPWSEHCDDDDDSVYCNGVEYIVE